MDNKRINYLFFVFCILFCCCVQLIWCGTCYYQTSTSTYRICERGGGRYGGGSYYTCEGGTRYYRNARCCTGWTGTDCNTPICATLTNPSACTLREGYVKESASGPDHTLSGGTCVAPGECAACNNGYYPDGPYCKACPEISNCYYTSCTNPNNRECKYCHGVLKDDPSEYGWWAFTRWTDGGRSCKVACSWRAGSRCYPGSCSDTTIDSCQCADGFSGTDCATITDKPVILQSTATLKQITDTSVESIDGPIDTSSPSPQDTVWTNNLLIHSVSGSVDAQYVKILPELPRSDFYINKHKSRVGIVSGGVSFQLQRAGISTPSDFTITCPESVPKPNNYRCEGNFNFPDKWSSLIPFKHLDKIIFKTFATNGGYITTFDRENNDIEVPYHMVTNSFTNTFYFGFETEPPSHCKMVICDTDPLTIPDASSSAVFDITWDGWGDIDSGLKSFHFEVFHLRPTGSDIDSELTHGDKVTEGVPEGTTVDVNTISITVPTPGPFSLMITAMDKAGNHRSARRVMIFDDISVVELQGDISHTSDTNGGCTWLTEPGAPVVTNAEPLSNCEWINKPTSLLNIGWKNRFINVRHHAGQWLNRVSNLDHVLDVLDDHEGIRQLERKPNILGIVRFELSYNVTYEGSTTIFPFVETVYVETETTEILENMEDGKGINITIRAFDIVDAYIDDHLIIKSDTSKAIIENLWLTRGNHTDLAVHNVEEFDKLTIEWETYDYHSGIHEVKWRVYDNYTGNDIIHGVAYESPQGETETIEHCEQTYGHYPRGASCYCTPFDGCFHKHFQVKPVVVRSDTSGIISGKHIGAHDSDFFIEVTVTNKAMLAVSVVKKITIDTSPPVTGIVQEGMSGSPDVDFQQDSMVHVHWSGFFDEESGVWFYKYGYGTTCLTDDDFGIDDQHLKTYNEYASFDVPTGETYYVTVVAYNRALDHSEPVCSDGITIDDSIPAVGEVIVTASRTRPRFIQTEDNGVWYLHDDRRVQRVDEPSEICRSYAAMVPDLIFMTLPKWTDSTGRIKNTTSDMCEKLKHVESELLTILTTIRTVEIAWVVLTPDVHVHDFMVGLSSTESTTEPDITTFKSSKRHHHIRIDEPNIIDGQRFYIVLETISKSNKRNRQVIGPFLLDSTPPSFQGTIQVKYDSGKLVAEWNDDAVADVEDPNDFTFEYAVGTRPYGVDVHPFTSVKSGGSCVTTEPPTCTAINTDDLTWSLHGHHTYYMTIKVTNTGGKSVLATSDPYVHDVMSPREGVVLDVDATEHAHVLDDIDFQTSLSSMTGIWHGFSVPTIEVHYTACMAENGVIDADTCIDVREETRATLPNLQLTYFKTYQFAVIARSNGGNITVLSDGVMTLDTDLELDNIQLCDGPPCVPDIDSSSINKLVHHDTNIIKVCVEDISYQASLNSLILHWNISAIYDTFTPDVYWHIQERAPVVDHWTIRSEREHISSSVVQVATSYPLQSGRSYRFAVQFCAHLSCFPEIYSDGVTVIHNPPEVGSLVLEYSETDTKIQVTLEQFYDGDIEEMKEAQEAIDHYEYAITDNGHTDKTVTIWTRIEDIETVNENEISFTVQLAKELQFTTCWKLAVRGNNKAGLYSVVSGEIRQCEDKSLVPAPIVIDAVGQENIQTDWSVLVLPITFTETEAWLIDDKDYTPTSNIISAVWPSLRYPSYTWTILEYNSLDSILYYNEISAIHLVAPCDVPESIKCGTTSEKFINIDMTDSELINGKRYIVCIHSNSTVLRHELWEEPLPEISVCSDGVTVDLTAPIPGDVWISQKHETFQTSSTDLTIYWESFVDIEELQNAFHSTGIRNYEVAIGSHPGDVDVMDYKDVGVTNHVTLHGLELQNGHKYYAIIKGTDFTGRYSTSVSPPITVDDTPPVTSDVGINIHGRHITDSYNINPCWTGLFSDPDSSIVMYKWSIGSRPGYDDMYPYTYSQLECTQVVEADMSELQEGHVYYVSVLATNGAGLSAMATSWGFTVDFTPPVVGKVYDGQQKDKPTDIDCQSDIHSLTAYWTGFVDPHTSIKEYLVEIGTQNGGNDIIKSRSYGLSQEIVIEHLLLTEGFTYYVTVTACNTAGMCSSVCSDGVMIDSSPPIPGRVNDGTDIMDIQYQHSSTFVGAKWSGFVDAQSGISHYTWRVGIIPGGDDILAARDVHTSDVAIEANLVNDLPKNKRLYSTIRAYNIAGMWSESSSNGFTIDESDPVIIRPLTHVSIGSIVQYTSILKTVKKFIWNIEDEESFIERQYMSIMPHTGEDFNMTVEIPGYIRDYTFTGLSLHDGSLYDVTLIACNGARICVESRLYDILVDTTPPIAGTFAINTDHAAELDRESDVWMVWDSTSLHLAWLGFTDEHSSIASYMINVGTEYMAADLNEVPYTAYHVSHNDSTHHEVDDGKVQVFQISTQPLTGYQHVFITIWAVNGVGLRSDIVHSQFTLIPGGDMELVRRCSGYSCEGHCVCAARDRKCPLGPNSMPCNDVTGDSRYASVEVKDLIYLTEDTVEDTLTRYTPVNTVLSASWEPTGTNLIMPKWYEWSVGLSGFQSPSGVLISTGLTWHDAADTHVIHYTLKSGEMLHYGEAYSVFVRAWYNGTTFADYKSNGVTILSSYPTTSNLFGKTVKEVVNGGAKDVDYISTTNGLRVDWTGKFNTVSSYVWKYKVYLNSYPGGHDLHVFGADLSGDTTSVNMTILDTELEPGVRYYSTVQAYNHAGLHTTVTSDGFVLDIDKPISGMVIDGLGMSDVQYQNMSTMISARWYGFTDLTSSIRSYQWCVSTSDTPGSCNVVPEMDVGKKITVTKQLESAMENGQQVISEVRAKDMVGHTSDTVESNGVIIDTTPPVPLSVEDIKQNILHNPSFETYTALNYIDLDKFDPTRECSHIMLVEGWDIEGCTAVVVSDVHNVQDGQAFIWTRGSIKQSLDNLEIGHVYRLSFYVSHLPTVNNIALHAEGFVEMDAERHMFRIHSKPGRPGSLNTISWQLVTYYFTLTKSTTTLTIGSMARSYGINIDNVQLQEMTHTIVDDLTTNHVSLYTVFIHDWSAVHASWNFEDPESGIKEYIWAIGTVKGGTQLQEFKNVGTRLFGMNSELHLPHMSSIYITVVATNGAGYKTVSYSDPLVVDLTPPELVDVNDGLTDGVDIDFQDSYIVSVNFVAFDEESGIQSCSWGIGIYSGDVSILDFTDIPTGHTATFDAIDMIDSTSKVFTSVRCMNNAGLTATTSSNGVQMLLDIPSIAAVNVDVLEVSDTQYPVHDNYHGRNDQLRVRWTGFDKHAWVEQYQVQLKGNNFGHTVLVQDPAPGYIYASFDDLELSDGLYTVSITGVNKLEVESDQAMANVTILTTKPTINDATGVEVNWDSTLEEATVTWSGVFTSTHSLYYEVSVGNSAGSVDIIQWQETRSEQLKFTLDADTVGQFGVEIYVVVRAITPSGMYATAFAQKLLT